MFPINWSAQHAIPQGHRGQFVAGTQGSRSPHWGCSPSVISQPSVEDSCWNGRSPPQGRLLSSLAKHPALPLPQHYQNTRFFNKTNRERGSNFATKKAHGFHGRLITFYENTNHEAICFKQRVFSPLQTDNNPIKEPTSRILDNVWHCVIISIPLVFWQGTATLSWSSWQRSKAQLIGATAAPLSSDCHANSTRFFNIIMIPGVLFYIKLYPGKLEKFSYLLHAGGIWAKFILREVLETCLYADRDWEIVRSTRWFPKPDVFLKMLDWVTFQVRVSALIN